MITGDTIAAISSATGSAPRMVVRVNGPNALAIARSIAGADLPPHSAAIPSTLDLDGLRVRAWCYIFIAPRSYTAENVVEFHIPGNPLLAKLLLDEIIRAGARQAEPGEFTARAYFNGRLDLTEAEGVAATISAGNEQELAAARRLMSGELVRRLSPAIDSLADTLALVEVGIDFSDEDVTFLPAGEVSRRVAAVDQMLANLLAESSRFEKLSHEPVVVLAGRPNAGKSTLLNTLAGHERAVASPVAGTTRDVLSAQVRLPRGMIRLIDVAGLDEALTNSPIRDNDASQPEIERKMREQALRAVGDADHLVFIQEARDSRPPGAWADSAKLFVRSKSDTTAGAICSVPERWIAVSALTGDGMENLRAALDKICFGGAAATAALSLNARHVRAINDARSCLSRAASQIEAGAEFLALELRQALDALGQVSGKIPPDDLLGRVFSAFCIGK